MQTWIANWQYNDVLSGHHEETGTVMVEAENEGEASYMARCKVSEEIFGAITMQRYVKIWSIRVQPQ